MTTKKTAATPTEKTPGKKTAASAKSTAGQPGKATVKSPGEIPLEQAARKSKKERKIKMVRDSFTMPQDEYRKIAGIKKTCRENGLQVKKSEVLRAGLRVLAELDAAHLKGALSGLAKNRAVRSKKR